jgi:hypothetical protein
VTRLDAPARPGLMARIAYWFSRRRFGRVLEPLTVTAHHPRVMRGYGQMELALEGARTLPKQLKVLAQVRAALRVGCPF